MKKSVIVILIVILIIVIGVFAFSGDNNKQNDTLNNETQIKETVNEQINEQANEIIANEVVNETTNELVSNENTVSSETFEESPKTAEEKAIDIVKKDWGEDTSMNFSVEGMDGNGNYIVTVRNSDTVALAFYSVNVTNENFTKREMN